MTEFVDLDAGRRQALGEGNSFLERLLHLLVVQGVGGTVDPLAAVGDRRAAPRLQELEDEEENISE